MQCIIVVPAKTQADGPWWRNSEDGPNQDDPNTGPADDDDEEQSGASNASNDSDEEHDQDVHDASMRPQNKKELASLRTRFQNTMHLVAHLYHDLTLRDDMRMVYYAAFHFKKEYSYMLQQQKSQD